MGEFSRIVRVIFAGAITVGLLVLGSSPASGLPAGKDGEEEKPPTISGPGHQLVYPILAWSKIFPGKLQGVAVAKTSGAVAAITESKLYYFKDDPTAAWTAGDNQNQDWKHLQDLYLNADGSRVFFQSDLKPRVHTETMELTLHLFDGAGRELWAKPNLYRYQSAMMSPTGKYIIIGELFHGGIKVHDDNLNLLWEKNVQFWYIAYDPLERYLFDGEGGILYTVKGEQVWDFGGFTRILSVSDNAEYVMTQYYRTVQSSSRMFLMGRLALKKVELAGTGGCVSPDGSLAAYVNADQKLVVYRTLELLEAGPANLPPLYHTGFIKPKTIQISRDNRSLLAVGQESVVNSAILLVNLDKMKTAFKKPIDADIQAALATEDNRLLVIKAGTNAIMAFNLY
jgi:hypothetical protein